MLLRRLPLSEAAIKLSAVLTLACGGQSELVTATALDMPEIEILSFSTASGCCTAYEGMWVESTIVKVKLMRLTRARCNCSSYCMALPVVFGGSEKCLAEWEGHQDGVMLPEASCLCW